jgi:hypothetical protein
MKNYKNAFAALFMVAVLVIGLSSCSKSSNTPGVTGNAAANLKIQVSGLPYEALSESEKSTLIFMREEEKLARDVYTTLYSKWGVNMFTNISASEQTHMDGILLLLNKYGLADPAANKGIGEFNNTALQTLYNELVAKGNVSITEAYIVGAIIEDLDLSDLKNALAGNDNQDIKVIYESLAKGSRNHMRSFNGVIINSGLVYTPQFITQTEFDAIVNSSMEKGF